MRHHKITTFLLSTRSKGEFGGCFDFPAPPATKTADQGLIKPKWSKPNLVNLNKIELNNTNQSCKTQAGSTKRVQTKINQPNKKKKTKPKQRPGMCKPAVSRLLFRVFWRERLLHCNKSQCHLPVLSWIHRQCLCWLSEDHHSTTKRHRDTKSVQSFTLCGQVKLHPIFLWKPVPGFPPLTFEPTNGWSNKTRSNRNGSNKTKTKLKL